MQSLKVGIATLLLGLALLSGRAIAAPVVYSFTLTPDFVDPTGPFGIPSLPAGPFTGSFSIDDSSLTVDGDDIGSLDNLLGFDVSIGTASWSLGDLGNFQFDVTGGELSSFTFFALNSDSQVLFRLDSPGWTAIDMDGSCNEVSLVSRVSAGCIMGLKSDTVSFTRVPEPASFAVLGFGLAGLAFARRRRTR